MNSKTEPQHSKLDIYKLVAASALFILALFAFYYFSDFSLLVRVIGLLVAAGASVAIALRTAAGGSLLEFFQDSRTELRKVVWPTWTETWRASLAVIAVVIIMGLILWALDWVLFRVVRLLTS